MSSDIGSEAETSEVPKEPVAATSSGVTDDQSEDLSEGAMEVSLESEGDLFKESEEQMDSQDCGDSEVSSDEVALIKESQDVQIQIEPNSKSKDTEDSVDSEDTKVQFSTQPLSSQQREKQEDKIKCYSGKARKRTE